MSGNVPTVEHGPTAGTTPPNGGGTYVYGMKSVEPDVGAVALFCTQANFSPIADGKGGRITGALKRSSNGSPTGFAPFMFLAAQASDVSGEAYVLGLSDETASRIELRKGPLVDGVPAVSLVSPAVSPFILMRSTDTFLPNTWQHLRLDVIKQGTGDVILQVFRNDLALHSVNSPVWAAVPGMEGPQYPVLSGFVDDSLGVNTGSVPIAGGRAGFGCRFDASNRVAYFDHFSVDRQL